MSRIERLWAPWRKAYIKKKKQGPGCLFCRLRRTPQEKDPSQLILRRGQLGFIVLNRFPYNNGHLMVVPNRHVALPEKLSTAERLELFSLLDTALKALRRVLKPHGFNVGLNLGKAAGAGVTGHLHLHLVPRWTGDSNFMPLIGETKVISDSLQATYRELVRRLK